MRIEATELVPARREEIFAFLADLENHWALADRFVEVVSLEREGPGAPARGGRVRMRGPLGVRRTADTRVEGAEPPAEMFGSALVGGRTRAKVRWTLAELGEETSVRLAAEVEHARALDALALRLGGRRWLERRFADVLDSLGRRMERSGHGARTA